MYDIPRSGPMTSSTGMDHPDCKRSMVCTLLVFILTSLLNINTLHNSDKYLPQDHSETSPGRNDNELEGAQRI